MRYLCVLALLVAGCGSSPSIGPSPTPSPVPAPTPAPAPAPSPAPSVTITGTITSTTTGAAVGAFSQTVPSLPARLTVSAPGYVSRETMILSATPRVDLFPENGFNLTFYRQIARDNASRPLFVLTQSPSFYMEVEGAKGLAASVSVRLEAVARRIVPAMTGGRLTVARWETGPTPRAPQVGWIMVERRDEQGICGSALVGAPAGQIWMDGNGQNCSFEAVFAHEIGHALGFFHTDRAGSMMFPQQRNSNLADSPSEIERHHAALAYARPRGNQDVDRDPSSFTGLSASQRVVD